MDQLWDADGWMTPGELTEALKPQHNVAYTTVMTVLVRLWKKGLLERRRRGRAFEYRARESRTE